MPDPLVRIGIRHLLTRKLREESVRSLRGQQQRLMDFIKDLRNRPIAEQTKAANEQHYEAPTEFFQHCLGPRMKYSCALWEPGTSNLAEAEEEMLELTCRRAEIRDGQEILELGCGWGSLTMWIAERFPGATITGVSNSRTQKLYIDGEAKRRGLGNIQIITADMNHFVLDRQVDRVVSVEMFEHMKNYEALFARVASWTRPGGKFFLHIFTHRRFAYHYEGVDPSDWITRYFFAGGMMPADTLPLYFQRDLRIENHWHVSGKHYQKTSEAWLKNMDRNRTSILPILAATYGEAQKIKWLAYWRTFYMACAELWGFAKGSEWIVSHYRFLKP